MASASLPLEIWNDVLSRLPHTAHLKLRLVSKILSQLATPAAFSTVYVGWLPQYFTKLQAIATSHLKHHVRRVNIELDLLDPDAGPPDRWRLAERSWSIWQEDQVVNAANIYHSSLVNKQVQLLSTDIPTCVDSGKLRHSAFDMRAALVGCMETLPCVSDITIVSSHDLVTRLIDYKLDESTSDTATPTSSNMDWPIINEDHQFLRLIRHQRQALIDTPFVDIQSSEFESQLNWIVHSVILAASNTPSKIRNLKLPCISWIEALENYSHARHLEDFAHATGKGFSHLQRLELAIDTNTTFATNYYYVHTDVALTHLLQHAKSIEELILHIDLSESGDSEDPVVSDTGKEFYTAWDQSHFFKALDLPKLRKLHVSALAVEKDTFLQFMSRHKHNLREIESLSGWLHSGLSNENPRYSDWERAIKDLAKDTTLSRVDLGLVLDFKLWNSLHEQIPKDNYHPVGSPIVWEGAENYSRLACQYLQSKGDCEYPCLSSVKLSPSCWKPKLGFFEDTNDAQEQVEMDGDHTYDSEDEMDYPSVNFATGDLCWSNQ